MAKVLEIRRNNYSGATMSRDMRDVMFQWARWRKGRISAGLYWPTACTLGKMMDGMKSTDCKCRGRDEDCELCFGAGRVKMDPGGSKANPALISSTHRQADDEQSQNVDRIMCELRVADKTRKFFFVLWAEYVRTNGTQEMKAERIKLSHGNYRTILWRAHQLVEIGLDSVTKSSGERVTQA